MRQIPRHPRRLRLPPRADKNIKPKDWRHIPPFHPGGSATRACEFFADDCGGGVGSRRVPGQVAVDGLLGGGGVGGAGDEGEGEGFHFVGGGAVVGVGGVLGVFERGGGGGGAGGWGGG